MSVLDVMTPGSAQGDKKTIYIFGVRVDNMMSEDALECIRQYIAHGNGSCAHTVFFTNVHSIMLARWNSQFRHCVDQADLVLPDGSGLMLAGNLFGIPIAENVNGTDFTPKLLRQAEDNGWNVYLLGAQQNVIEQCYRRLLLKFPGLNIVSYHHGHFGLDEEETIVNAINEKRPHLLLVGLVSPYQEQLIARYAGHLKVQVCLAVGGLFDFLSESVPRAPLKGIGFGSKYDVPVPLFPIKFSLYVYIPHNEILWLLVKMGAIGFFSFWLFLGSFVFQGASVFSQLRNPYFQNMIYLGLLMGLLLTLEKLDKETLPNPARAQHCLP